MYLMYMYSFPEKVLLFMNIICFINLHDDNATEVIFIIRFKKFVASRKREICYRDDGFHFVEDRFIDLLSVY